jgi:hypothetical protein
MQLELTLMKVAGQGVGESMKRVPLEVTAYTSSFGEKPTFFL